MADAKIPDISPDRRLRGKVNYVTWKREFDREAKAYDVLDLFTGDEEILVKPKKEDYIDDDADDEKDPNTIAATQKTLKGFHATTLRYTIDYNNWKSNKESLRTANKLLNAWVSDSIRIEIEVADNAKEAYDLIITRYKISDERARDDLLTQMKQLEIDDCDDVTDYLNKLRRYKSDLAGVGYKMTDSMYATALLDGLDSKKWAGFKEKWDTIRAMQLDTNPKAGPSIDLLEDRLHHEALNKQRREEEKKKQNKDKDKAKAQSNTDGARAHDSSSASKNTDKSQLKCGGCGKPGHTEESCWKLHPEKMPRALKNKFQSKTDNNTQPQKDDAKVAAFAAADVDKFNSKLAAMDSLGMHLASSPMPDTLADSPQTRKCCQSNEIGGAGGGATTREGCAQRYGSILSSAIGAFMAGPVRSSSVWLADSAANMHVVNDPKWFTDFRSFDVDINTADNSAVLQVRGGGKVEVLLLNKDRQPIKLRLSNVAYAPKGRCNLLSLGILAEKAGVCGRWDAHGMTLSVSGKGDIGYAPLSGGLFYPNIEPLSVSDNPFQSGEVIAAVIDFDDPVWRMHRRLGHLSFQSILNLKKISTGMNITEQ
jgi:hypothetical protein